MCCSQKQRKATFAVADLEYHKEPRKVVTIKINDTPSERHDNIPYRMLSR